MGRSVHQYLEGLQVWGVKDIPVARGEPTTRAEDVVRVMRPGVSREHVKGPPRSAKAAALADLEQDVIACTRCPLYRTRTHHVVGEGSPHAKLVFVGEAPGREEDLQGRPFVGAAGQLLTKMIEAIGLARRDVYICNVLKDRPPGNRTPLPEEVEACVPFLVRQIAMIQPHVICALGAVAAKALLGPHVSITQVRGQRHTYQGILMIPTFHPAYLLRNPAAKRLVWQDLKKVKRLLEGQEQ